MFLRTIAKVKRLACFRFDPLGRMREGAIAGDYGSRERGKGEKRDWLSALWQRALVADIWSAGDLKQES